MIQQKDYKFGFAPVPRTYTEMNVLHMWQNMPKLS